MSDPVEITDENFQQEVLNSETPVLVDFWADWCQPCKMIAPVVEQIAEEYDGKVKIGKLDVDSNQQTSQAMGIRGCHLYTTDAADALLSLHHRRPRIIKKK